MNLRETIKKIWFSLYDSGRIVLLDYKIKPKRLYSEEKRRPHKSLYEIINKNRAKYQELLEKVLKYKEVFSSIKEDKALIDEYEPGWNNKHLPGLDIIMMYSLIAELKPAKYIEIGGGTSTKVAYKSKKDNALNVEIISIDPSPRKEISKLTDKNYKEEIQNVDPEIFCRLKENDIVFIDGTHTLFPNSDVMWFFLEIFPKLQKGTIVHIHDIYLPYDYPDFMCARYYSEQYVLGALLLTNSDKYEIISPNYFIYSDKHLSSLLKPIFELDVLRNVEKHGGSFWIKIKS
jgi:Methyltransferase domain